MTAVREFLVSSHRRVVERVWHTLRATSRYAIPLVALCVVPVDTATAQSFRAHTTSSPGVASSTFGTPIRTRSDLESVQIDVPGVRYYLCNDIDLQGVPFTPLGAVSTSAFRGRFDGRGHAIRNLRIASTADGLASAVGLFRGIGVDGAVVNLRIENPRVLCNGGAFFGALVGVNRGTISDVVVSGAGEVGSAVVPFSQIVGGLIGLNYGSVHRSRVIGDAPGSLVVRGERAGGLIGWAQAHSSIEQVETLVRVEVWDDVGGGLIGWAVGLGTRLNDPLLVRAARASGEVVRMWGTGAVGGLIGGVQQNVWVDRSWSDCHVDDVLDVAAAGGLIGRCWSYSMITDCYATGDVDRSSLGGYSGGLIGFAGGSGVTIARCYARGHVSVGIDPTYWHGLVGGLVPNAGVVTDSYFSSDANPLSPIDPLRGEGRTDLELETLSTYPPTWDIDYAGMPRRTWGILAPDGTGLPYLTEAP